MECRALKAINDPIFGEMNVKLWHLILFLSFILTHYIHLADISDSPKLQPPFIKNCIKRLKIKMWSKQENYFCISVVLIINFVFFERKYVRGHFLNWRHFSIKDVIYTYAMKNDFHCDSVYKKKSSNVVDSVYKGFRIFRSILLQK